MLKISMNKVLSDFVISVGQWFPYGTAHSTQNPGLAVKICSYFLQRLFEQAENGAWFMQDNVKVCAWDG